MDPQTAPLVTANPAMPAAFLKLPAELRNWIYELLLVQDEPIETCGLIHTAKWRRQRFVKAFH
jgi:hypothetical protein